MTYAIQKFLTCTYFAAINHQTGTMEHLLKYWVPIFRQDNKSSGGGEGQDLIIAQYKILMRFVSHLLGISKMPRFWSIDVNKGRIQLFPQAMGGEHCKLGWTNFSSNMAAVTGEITVPLTIVCILVQHIFVVSLFISILSL